MQLPVINFEALRGDTWISPRYWLIDGLVPEDITPDELMIGIRDGTYDTLDLSNFKIDSDVKIADELWFTLTDYLVISDDKNSFYFYLSSEQTKAITKTAIAILESQKRTSDKQLSRESNQKLALGKAQPTDSILPKTGVYDLQFCNISTGETYTRWQGQFTVFKDITEREACGNPSALKSETEVTINEIYEVKPTHNDLAPVLKRQVNEEYDPAKNFGTIVQISQGKSAVISHPLRDSDPFLEQAMQLLKDAQEEIAKLNVITEEIRNVIYPDIDAMYKDFLEKYDEIIEHSGDTSDKYDEIVEMYNDILDIEAQLTQDAKDVRDAKAAIDLLKIEIDKQVKTATDAAATATSAEGQAKRHMQAASQSAQDAHDDRVATGIDKNTAVGARDSALHYAKLSSQWADNNENDPVPDSGGRFSSKHHAIKSAASAAEALESKKKAEQAAGKAEEEALKVVGRLVDRGEWTPQPNELFPPAPDEPSIWVINKDVEWTNKGIHWQIGDCLLYSKYSSGAHQWTQLSGNKVLGNKYRYSFSSGNDYIETPSLGLEVHTKSKISLSYVAPKSKVNSRQYLVTSESFRAVGIYLDPDGTFTLLENSATGLIDGFPITNTTPYPTDGKEHRIQIDVTKKDVPSKYYIASNGGTSGFFVGEIFNVQFYMDQYNIVEYKIDDGAGSSVITASDTRYNAMPHNFIDDNWHETGESVGGEVFLDDIIMRVGKKIKFNKVFNDQNPLTALSIDEDDDLVLGDIVSDKLGLFVDDANHVYIVTGVDDNGKAIPDKTHTVLSTANGVLKTGGVFTGKVESTYYINDEFDHTNENVLVNRNHLEARLGSYVSLGAKQAISGEKKFTDEPIIIGHKSQIRIEAEEHPSVIEWIHDSEEKDKYIIKSVEVKRAKDGTLEEETPLSVWKFDKEGQIEAPRNPTRESHLVRKQYVDREIASAAGNWKTSAQTETDMNRMRENNRNLFAASGYVDYGQASDTGQYESINEGLYVREHTAYKNAALYARLNTSQNGTSNNKYPVLHAAGFTTKLFFNNIGDDHGLIKFPEAPNGVQVYDATGNARGTGKPNLDLYFEIDPKYGNAAKDNGGIGEAAGRAFEGAICNADFRNANVYGVQNWSKLNSSSISSLGNGKGKLTTSSISNGMAIVDGHFEKDRKYKVRLYVERANFSNCSFRINDAPYDATEKIAISDNKWCEGIITAKSDSDKIYIYSDDKSQNMQFYGLSVTAIDEEVVTDRVDLFGWECFLEEITEDNPFVYPNGLIQCQSLTMNGLPTYLSNRPKSYFAFYDGDEETHGRGVNIFDISDDEKKKLVSHKDNNIFILNDGRVVQWRVRCKTYSNMKNGNWRGLGSYNSYGTVLACGNNTWDYISAQGMRDQVPKWHRDNETTSIWYPQTHKSLSNVENIGIYKAGLGNKTNDEIVGVNGECYFYLCGAYQRLNTGAAHPTHNPMGANCGLNRDRRSAVKWTEAFWALDRTRDCFWYPTLSKGYPWKDGRIWINATGQAGGGIDLGVGVNGRQDGRFYDSCYQGGQGGLIDYRMSAYDMSSKEEAAKIFNKVVEGVYRGQENLPFTRVAMWKHIKTGRASWDSGQGGRFTYNASSTDWVNARGISSTGCWSTASPQTIRTWLVSNTGAIWEVNARTQAAKKLYSDMYFSSGKMYAGVGSQDELDRFNDMFGLGVTIWIVQTADCPYKKENWESGRIPISGDFYYDDVIGKPEYILNNKHLKNGWRGGWINQLPDGKTNVFEASRKWTGKGKRLRTSNNGANWTALDWDDKSDATKNNIYHANPERDVSIITYVATAYQTKSSSKDKVFNQSAGVGEVFATQGGDTWTGVLLHESLTGKVGKATASSIFVNNVPVKNLNGWHQGTMTWTSSRRDDPEHEQISLTSPVNNSPAVKALWYQTSSSQVLGLNFAYNELKYHTPSIISVKNASHRGIKQGAIYKMQGSDLPLRGQLIYSVRDNAGFAFHQMYMDSKGKIYWSDTDSSTISHDSSVYEYISGVHEWGDDSTIRINYGQNTYTNLNGDTCLYGSNELAIPYGYSKNQSRAGTQTKGVDI